MGRIALSKELHSPILSGKIETMNTSTETAQAEYTITLPKLVGARSSADELTAELPADLSTADVIVDATANQASSQGFVDQLCTQIMEIRLAKSLTVVNHSGNLRKWVELSARNRYFSERISFQD